MGAGKGGVLIRFPSRTVVVRVLVVALLAFVLPQAVRGAEVQAGDLNYAGPNCPGGEWNCTAITDDVEQTGQHNIFECSGSSCRVLQTTTDGVATNEASCTQRSGKALLQTCDITQDSSGGNTIDVIQEIATSSKKPKVTQDGEQVLFVDQFSRGGLNTLTIDQSIEAIASSTKDLTKSKSHVQEANQSVHIRQVSTTANQTIDVRQAQNLSSSAKSKKKIVQHQNHAENGPNMIVDVDQLTETGQESFTVEQDMVLGQNGKAAKLEQVQGSNDTGGEDVGSDEDIPGEPWGIDATNDAGGGHAIAQITQNKDWTQDGKAAPGFLVQEQTDKLRVRNLGLSPNVTSIGQTTDLTSGPDAHQWCRQEVDTHTEDTGSATGNCTIDNEQHIQTDGDNNLQYFNEVEQSPATISGVVRDARTSAPISGANVELTLGEILLDAVDTDAQGRYSVSAPMNGGDPPDDYDLDVSKNGYGDEHRDVSLEPGDAEIRNIDLHREGTISGRVLTAATGTAIQGATVTSEEQAEASRLFASDVGGATTSSKGRYTIDDVDPGTHTVTASANGYIDGVEEVDVGPNEDVTGVTFALIRESSIQGRVFDLDTGEYIVGAVAEIDGVATDVTDGDGRYYLDKLPPGDHTVEVTADGYQGFSQAFNVSASGIRLKGRHFSLHPAQFWDARGDFVPDPGANPAGDSYGNDGVWSYLLGSTPLPNFFPDDCNTSGDFQFWQGADGSNNAGWFGVNHSADPAPCAHTTIPGDRLAVFHRNTIPAVLEWSSPFSGPVDISGAFEHLGTYDVNTSNQVAGDGMSWVLKRDGLVLSHGSFADLATQNLVEGSGGTQAIGGVPVDAGTVISLEISSDGDYPLMDYATMDFTISTHAHAPHGMVFGQVTDQGSGPIAGAIVSIAGYDSVTTDSDGRYVIADIDPGDHSMLVGAPPFGAQFREVTVPSNGVIQQDFVFVAGG